MLMSESERRTRQTMAAVFGGGIGYALAHGELGPLSGVSLAALGVSIGWEMEPLLLDDYDVFENKTAGVLLPILAGTLSSALSLRFDMNNTDRAVILGSLTSMVVWNMRLPILQALGFNPMMNNEDISIHETDQLMGVPIHPIISDIR